MKLLSRYDFVRLALDRDNDRCVICKATGDEVHHIVERKLWTDGGYYIENAATLCPPHHLEAEKTLLSCDAIRRAAGIEVILLPDHFEPDYVYDKWGNVILPNGTRMKGEMFYFEQVQKILTQAGLINSFNKYVKYPRTFHLPHSHMSGDDKRLTDYSIFEKKNIVVTVKMDGENTTMYNDYIHARSLSASDHLSRDYVKGIWGKISYMLDDDMRLCGENMFALHTVKYDNLESYFLLFSIWVRDTCLSWKETQDYATILGLKTVPVIYEGVYDLQQIEEAFKNYGVNNPTEGYVIRLVDEFRYFNFKNSVAKYVKPEFMVDLKKRDGHWQQMKVVPNKILK